MHLAITHETRYRYSPQVQTAHHVAHLQPSNTPCQTVICHAMQTDPEAMVQHHIGALQMSEFVFDIGAPAVGALAKQIWRQQDKEIKAMGQWRKAWYPEAPVYPVALPPGADPNDLAALKPMTAEQITAMRMLPGRLTAADRVAAYLTAMIQHHGAALAMARDALANSANPSSESTFSWR